MWMFGIVALAALVTYAILPYASRLAYRNGLVDLPGQRKKHARPTPACGGVAIFVALVPMFLGLFVLALRQDMSLSARDLPKLASLFCACAWMLVLGILDDKKNLTWSVKLAGQAVGVLILAFGGHSVAAVKLPFLGTVVFGWAGILVFGVILIGITNAINLIDGLDGLAAGICLFASVAGGVTGYLKGDILISIMHFTLTGALIGFLPYNWPPARVFLGDGGSMMLGFFLGTLAVSSATVSVAGQRSPMLAALVAPFLPFFIAFLDVGLTIVRRWMRGRKIYLPDRDHLHHRLAREFSSVARVNFVVYSFSGAFAVLSVLIAARHQVAESAWAPLLVGFLLTSLTVLLLRTYRMDPIHHVPRVMAERGHFKFLDLYERYMAARLSRAKSVSECVALLESGVTDLRMDAVILSQGDECIKRWDNEEPVHVGANRTTLTREMETLGLSVKAVVPGHERKSYQDSLESTWVDFLKALEARLVRMARVSEVHLKAHPSDHGVKHHFILSDGSVAAGRK
jgi:UDP-GlcNAc:undecaprenyl-phosphate GlcNAc-1-phosphate transferase